MHFLLQIFHLNPNETQPPISCSLRRCKNLSLIFPKHHASSNFFTNYMLVRTHLGSNNDLAVKSFDKVASYKTVLYQQDWGLPSQSHHIQKP